MFADKKDYFLMFFGTLGAVVNGSALPLMVILLGDALESLADADNPGVLPAVSEVALLFVYLAILVQFAAGAQMGCWSATGLRQSHALQSRWFKAVMRQDVAWFDTNNPEEMPARIASSISTFENGLGRKFGEGLQYGSTLLVALAIAFYYNWMVALVVMSCMPLIAGSGAMLVNVNASAEAVTQEAYAKAGATALEVLGSIRTVLSFNGLEIMRARYRDHVDLAEVAGVKKSLKLGFANASMLATFVLMYFVVTLFGSWLLSYQAGDYGCDPSGAVASRIPCDQLGGIDSTANSVFITLFCVAFGGQAAGQMATAIEAFTAARKALRPGVDVIQRVPVIDSLSDQGKQLERVEGNISVEMVNFSYPTRPDISVCNKYTLDIKAGETVALVGESGSGKSTIIQLIQRFYDPQGGSVRLDGTDLRELNVKWLRRQMALVGQEPVLFAGSIGENIAFGNHGRAVTQAEIEEAARLANAHGFIKAFPKGYDTEVGHGGGQLSGGQKQRIAIARALVSKPTILLLDEATSALDNQSEKIVQEALDSLIAKQKRTTLIIAHRLSTIRNADKIAVVAKGAIVELGSHDELMKNVGGPYFNLVSMQVGEAGGEDEGARDERKGSSERKLSSQKQSSAAGVQEKRSDGDGSEEENVDEPDVKVPWKRVWAMNKPDLQLILVGSLGAACAGAMYPLMGVAFAKMVGYLFDTRSTIYSSVISCPVLFFFFLFRLGFSLHFVPYANTNTTCLGS